MLRFRRHLTVKRGGAQLRCLRYRGCKFSTYGIREPHTFGYSKAVDALAGRVGGAVGEVSQEVAEMTLEHICFPHDQLAAAPHAPRIRLFP